MFLLLDIGGTHIRVSVSEDGQNLGDVTKIETPIDFDQAMDLIKDAAFELSKNTPFTKVVAGVRALDVDKKKLKPQPHFPLWVGKPLHQRLEQIFCCQVFIENDAALAGLGEALYGGGKGYNIVAYITVSTGVGGVRVVNGKIDPSVMGFEPGNQIINAEDVNGYLESYVSGEALKRLYDQKAEEITEPSIWDKTARLLAIGLNNTIVHWSPDVVILGGSVMKKISLDKIQTYLKQYLRVYTNIPQLKMASLADYAGLYGALAYIQNHT